MLLGFMDNIGLIFYSGVSAEVVIDRDVYEVAEEFNT